MTTTHPSDPSEYTLAELCQLLDMSARTVRYYVQNGLVDRPIGETRAARYGARHLEQLLQIRKWSAAGVSLDRIREILHGEPPPVAARLPQPGAVEVRSHLHVAEGVEVVIDPGRSGLSAEQLRQFVGAVMQAWAQIRVCSDVADIPQRLEGDPT
jgi:DNA-binding transcriptional MerR regulator